MKNWTTHMPMLLEVLLNSEGDVMEIGGGTYSTPLLHWLCKIQGRRLVTYENDPIFYKLESRFKSKNHSIRFIKNWDDIPQRRWGVIFIDHHPSERRIIDLIKFKDCADYLIFHDAERNDKYEWSQAESHFKYQYIDKSCKPWTGVVSNFKELDFLNGEVLRIL